ncbi:MAG: hypothetical protein QG612_668 [Pseudomonadota bacterium]|nr:hypothetical protein [Pseudomonadota bacterium]
MSNQFGAKAVLSSVLLTTGSTYVTYAAGLVTSMLIARGLGPADFGRYAYLVWLSGMLVLMMNHGLTTSAIRFVSESLGRESRVDAQDVHRRLQRWQGWSLLIVGLVFLAALPALRPAGWEGHLTLFAAVALLASFSKAWYLFSISVAKGYGRFGIEASSVSLLSLINLAGAGVMALLGSPLSGYMVLFLVISIAHPLMAARQLRRADIHKGKREIDEELLARVKPHLAWTMVSTLVATFSNKAIETYLLNHMAGAEAVGFFTIAATLARGGVDLLSSGLMTVLMPVLANAYGAGGEKRIHRLGSDAVRYFHFLGLLLTGIGFFWARPAIELTYGPSYAPAIFALQMMVLVRGVTLSYAAFGALLTVTDNQRLRAAEAGFAIVASAGMALWLVPTHGLDGAIYAHMVSTLAVFCFTFVCVRRVLRMPLPVGDLLRMNAAAVSAALLCFGVLSLSPAPSVWHQLLVGVLYLIVYLIATLVFKVWNQNDLAMMQKIGQRVPALQRLVFLMVPWARQV